ncbi:FCD domain-containing protein [Methylobacterium sp. E-005]|uniref:FadR/GntR family transcriptional regulator n=1 Tax=Methylobacterium sp. E-005 TaxID=2836549 RepID=UPI001FBAA623|nr:FCD domain-containing protein [Methylobacterium sp. E-005]MCJ2087935.1 FCD domain-containing protein [Methylobacterium sp. E-005]
MDDDAAPVLTLLQAYLAKTRLPADGRLPPERVLAEALGTSRGALRKALALMEADGQLWRHVGKGTFLGSRPLAAIDEVAALATRATASDLVQARLVLEPELAALAALRAGPSHVAALSDALRASCAPGQTWRGYELQDARLHREVALAAGNPLLLFLYDHLAAIRRVMTWDRPRVDEDGPPVDHPSFAEHDRIVAAIAARDTAASRRAMAAHVTAVHAAMAPA